MSQETTTAYSKQPAFAFNSYSSYQVQQHNSLGPLGILGFQQSLMISKHKDRSALESGQSHYPAKKKSGLKHLKKDTSRPFHIQKFIHNLKTQNLRTERYTSPNRNPDAKRNDSSRSKKLIKSFQTSRDKSGSAFKQTNRHKSKSQRPIIQNLSKLLRVSKDVTFSELVHEISDKLQEADKLIRQSKNKDGKDNVRDLFKKFKDVITVLLKSMIVELGQSTLQKENQLLKSVDSAAHLQTDILEQQQRMHRLQYQRDLYKRELDSSDRIIQKQNKYIRELKAKDNKVTQLIYCLRKKGLDIDQLFVEEVGFDEVYCSRQESIVESSRSRESSPSI